VKLLSLIHRWAGGLIGLLLALLGLTGTILLWEGEWISLPGAGDPVVERAAQLGSVSTRAIADGATRITFASEELGLHHLAMEGGAGAYVRQDGSVSAAWSSMWDRPELWIFDLHHHLFAGHQGELITGYAGLAGMVFVITGSILWWRSRRSFEWRLWPRKLQPGPIVRHHRDLGILIAPLLLLTFVTGSAMIFNEVAASLLSPLGQTERGAKPPEAAPSAGPAPVAAMLTAAKQRFPAAALRRLTVPSKPGAPYSVRMRQPFEWTPNGRTTLYFDGAGKLLRVDDPAKAGAAADVIEKFYPLHAAKVGGLAFKLLMTMSGLGLVLLGSLATWSFWFRRINRSRSRVALPRPVPAG